MAFTNTRGRFASFGIASSVPAPVIDGFWYIIDNNLKGVFELDSLLRFQLVNHEGYLSYQFSQEGTNWIMEVDFHYPFDPFLPRRVFVMDQDGNETILLPDEYEGF